MDKKTFGDSTMYHEIQPILHHGLSHPCVDRTTATDPGRIIGGLITDLSAAAFCSNDLTPTAK
jgi:hypothetical protein